MKHFVGLTACSFALLLGGVASADPPAQDEAPSRPSASPDSMFPRAGGFTATGATGIPFLAVGELAYGASNGFAIGAVAGATPDVGSIQGTMAFGVRPRGVLYASGPWRSYLAAPVFAYPQVQGFGAEREPWMLAAPSVTLERRFAGGSRVNVAFGAIGATCMDSIMTLGKEHTMMGGVWDTASVGGMIPLSSRTTVFGQGSLVMDGVVPATDWLGGTPVIALVGVTTAL
jgi:hypothetical protein